MNSSKLGHRGMLYRSMAPAFAYSLVVLGSFLQTTSAEDARRSSGDFQPEPATKQAPLEDIPKDSLQSEFVPSWAHEAVFYQIFPERFENGDPSNDPTRDSLESPDAVPDSWTVTPWTQSWYRRAAWEIELGDNFFQHGVYHRRYGGDLQGILNRLDYLEDLGVNTLYLNPVFLSRSLHKYNGDSFHHVDPYFGPDPKGDFEIIRSETLDPATWKMTSADKLFLKLIEEVHRRKMRIILDGVFNHTGRDFPAFADIIHNQQDSPFVEWYVVDQFDDPETPENEFRYKSWWGFDSLPEFANNATGDDLHPSPKAYIFAATKRWMDPDGDGNPKDGIDGWRLDVAEEVPPKFWQQWNRYVRELNPDSYTVAENWDDASSYLEECGFSATMNYNGFAYPVKGFFIDGQLKASEFLNELKSRRESFDLARRYCQQNLVDSHDTARIASVISNAKGQEYDRPDRWDYDVDDGRSPDYSIAKPTPKQQKVLRMIVLFQMMYVGPPQIYYGTESGMWGGDDPSNRMPMVWHNREYESQASDFWTGGKESQSVKFDYDLNTYFRYACRLRRHLPALQHGRMETISTSDKSQAFAIRRWDEQYSVYAVFNRGDSEYKWEFTNPRDKPLSEIFTASGRPDLIDIVTEGNKITVSIPGNEAVVLLQHMR